MDTAVENPRLLAAGHPTELAVGWLTMFVIGSDLFVVSPLLPLIAADYGIPSGLGGLECDRIRAHLHAERSDRSAHIADRVGRGRVLTCCLWPLGQPIC